MKTLLALALAALVGFGAVNTYNEIKTDAILADATELVAQYDLNADGVLSEDEQLSFVEDLYASNGGEFSKEEIENAINEATGILGQFDADNDGVLSYDEQLSIVQAVYEKYDNGEITDETFKAYLAGYEAYVDRLNSYHDLLDECGVPGANIQINIRKGK